jgi:hypothetical protein
VRRHRPGFRPVPVRVPARVPDWLPTRGPAVRGACAVRGVAIATPHGAGLGLAVARGFAEAMGSTLAAEDTPSGG